MAYFYGQQMDHIQLAEVMALARCVYGIHLDMNGIHAGWEYLALSGIKPGPRGLVWTTEAEKLTRRMFYKPFPRYIQRRPKDFFYLLRRPALPNAWGPLEVTALPQPGSARNLSAAIAGRHPKIKKLRLLAWSVARMHRPGPDGVPHTEGGLQILVPCVESGSAHLIEAATGEHSIVSGPVPEGSLALCGGGAHEGPIPTDGLRLLGVRGRSLALLEAPAGSEPELKAVLTAAVGWDWMSIGIDDPAQVRTRAAKGDRWVEYDGFAAEGLPIDPPGAAPARGLLYALPAERALVGALFEETP